jgi:hypothetical protein
VSWFSSSLFKVLNKWLALTNGLASRGLDISDGPLPSDGPFLATPADAEDASNIVGVDVDIVEEEFEENDWPRLLRVCRVGNKVNLKRILNGYQDPDSWVANPAG